MRERGNPWKWPVSVTVALGLTLSAAFLMPRGWLGWLVPSGAPHRSWLPPRSRPWLVIVPPPELESVVWAPLVPPVSPESRLEPDARWWTAGWAVSTRDDESLFRAPATGKSDTLAVILGALGLGSDFMTRARPDSVLASRLVLLRLNDGFRFDGLKPWLEHLNRSETYRDILLRAAELYDEPLGQEIRVPESGALKRD